MAHFAGLVAGGQHPSPLPHAHVCTATTYKNLRGVRGGIILAADEKDARKLNSAVFPGVQGSVILNAVAAKAVCLGEALRPEFNDYARAVLGNARALAGTLSEHGIDVVTGGTDTPLLLIDLRALGITGAEASEALETAGLVSNKNSVPGDTQPPTVTSGLRLGVSAGTTRGFGTQEFLAVGRMVARVLLSLKTGDTHSGATIDAARAEVRDLADAFPIYAVPPTYAR